MTLEGNPSLINSGFDAPPSNPMLLFMGWLKQADKIRISEPKGIILSTVDASGQPSSRVVLLKSCDEEGVTFATGQESAKGKDLEINPQASGTLWWKESVSQINFQGHVKKLSREISDAAFQARTRDAQAVAAISRQSALLADEGELRKKVLALVNSNSQIERPEGWHLYHLALETIEFWQGNSDRFHKRLHYHRDAEGIWHYQRLQP